MTMICYPMLFCLGVLFEQEVVVGMEKTDTLKVWSTSDFSLDGRGSHPNWAKADWNTMDQIDPGVTGYASRFKILYSTTGIYVLFQGKDARITTRFDEDFADLFHGDVFEVFFHPQPTIPLYFEYEINALGNELVLLIPNLDGRQMGWRPWHYEGNRKVAKRVWVEGGEAVAGGPIESWSAELFFPFALLQPLDNVPPGPGTCWNANFCRLEYDTGTMIKWSWSPIRISFHEFHVYKTITFQ